MSGPRRVTFRDVLRIQEFRSLWVAQLLSTVGDQLAVVALTILVFDQTGSPLLTAATYAISLLPWLLGGPLLAGLADLLPRRALMIVCDVVRAGLLTLMAWPGTPLWLLCVLLFATQLIAVPFGAARAALLPDVLPGDLYVLGNAVGNITNQLGQVIGFAAGGLLVGVLGSSPTLALDAVTFLVSAALLRWGVRHRPAARSSERASESLLVAAAAGVRLVWGSRDLRVLAGFGWLGAFYVVPEGLAAPYADQIGSGPAGVGILLAAAPCGTVVGALAYSRLVRPAQRLRLMGPLAVLACAPLVLCAVRPGLVASAVLLAVSGMASAYQLAANAAFVTAVPAQSRGQAFGLVQAGINVGQGLAIVVAGAAAQLVDAAWVIVVAGAAGCIAAVALARAWRRAPSFPVADGSRR